MSAKAELYEAQASNAPWHGTVNGRPAHVACFKGQWEIGCRTKKGVVMFKLTNRAAIRNVAELAAPPIPEKIVKKMMKGAVRDEPIPRRGSALRKLLVVLVLLAAAAYAVMTFFPESLDALRGLM